MFFGGINRKLLKQQRDIKKLKIRECEFISLAAERDFFINSEVCKMTDEQKIDDIIKMLDEKTTSGVSRIKVEIDENQQEQVAESRHYGRCDINSKDC